MNGAKRITEAMICTIYRTEVEERCLIDTSLTVKTGGVDQASEYVGISNEKIGEIPIRRKPKVSMGAVYPLRVSRYPKSRPIGVDDGKQVKYSCTTFWHLSEGVTQ